MEKKATTKKPIKNEAANSSIIRNKLNENRRKRIKRDKLNNKDKTASDIPGGRKISIMPIPEKWNCKNKENINGLSNIKNITTDINDKANDTKKIRFF